MVKNSKVKIVGMRASNAVAYIYLHNNQLWVETENRESIGDIKEVTLNSSRHLRFSEEKMRFRGGDMGFT